MHGIATRGAPGARVLVVEDEFLICDMIAEALTEQGYEVCAVGTAREALEHLLGGAPCDALLTDVNLRGGTDGEELARRVRELRPDLPVVYATGSVTRLNDLDAVPGAALIPKPYDPAKVGAVIGAFVSLTRVQA
jgi:CheY-like chemotaxis protein